MKRTILFFIVFCFMIGQLNAKVASFRSSSLAMIISDDLELATDPIELKFVEGSRLYTNLSNIVNSNEEILANNSDHSFLIGYSTKNPFVENLWNAIFIEFQKTKNANSVQIDSDLDGFDDIFGNGLLADEFTGYFDMNGDGIYDIIEQISQERSDYNEMNHIFFTLNNTYDTGDFIVGAKINYISFTSDGDESYDMNYAHHLIEEDYIDFFSEELDDGANHFLNSAFDLQASLLLPDYRGYELRGDLKFTNHNFSDEHKSNYHNREDFFEPEIFILEDYNIDEDVSEIKNENPGNSFALGASIRETFVEADQRKNDGYWKVGCEMEFGFSDYTNLEETTQTYTEKYFDGLDTLSTDYLEVDTNNAWIKDDGKLNRALFSLNGKLNYPFNEKVYFGIGFDYMYQMMKRETDFEESIENIYDYEILDEELTSADYITHETYSITADRTIDSYSSIFSVPVGIEYKFTNNNKWDLRFGSFFRSVCTTGNDAKEIKEATPYTTETIYGDGTVYIDIDDNTYDSSSEQTKSTDSSTNYYYGLGFRPTDNLQIDLLGFFGGYGDEENLLDADFYKQLRLSFTLKF